jgi:hypothetical protein
MAKGRYAIRAESRASQQLADLIATLRESLIEKETEVKELRDSLRQAETAITHSKFSEEMAKSFLRTKKRLDESELEKEKYISYLKEIITAINAQPNEIGLPVSFYLAAQEFDLQHETMLKTRTQRRNGLTQAKLKSALKPKGL